MTKRIFKYELKPRGEPLLWQPINVQMPFGAEILDTQIQGDGLFLWAIVDPERSNLTHTFQVFGTGWELPYRFNTRYKHLKTVQSGVFVWHVFEVIGE